MWSFLNYKVGVAEIKISSYMKSNIIDCNCFLNVNEFGYIYIYICI